eukprot:4343072-Pyramimonas_sp.AAC.1
MSRIISAWGVVPGFQINTSSCANPRGDLPGESLRWSRSPPMRWPSRRIGTPGRTFGGIPTTVPLDLAPASADTAPGSSSTLMASHVTVYQYHFADQRTKAYSGTRVYFSLTTKTLVLVPAVVAGAQPEDVTQPKWPKMLQKHKKPKNVHGCR